MYKNPDLRSKLTPTLAQLANYIKLAKADDSSRDTRPLLSWLSFLPQVDQHILGLIQTRKLALLGFQYRIDVAEGIKPSENDRKRIAEIMARFKASKISSLFNAIMNGILFGMSAVHLQWENDAFLKSRVKEKVMLDLTELDVNPKDASELLYVKTDSKTNNFFTSELNPEEYLIVRYNPLDGVDNNFLGSLAQANMLYVWLKYDDMFNWAKANNKFGDPTIWATYMSGATKEEILKVEEGLDALSNASRAAFSDKVKLQLLEAQRASIADMHDKLISTIKNEMSISYLGQTLTTDIGDVGSRAAAQVHNFVRMDYLWGDIIFFENVLSDQYVTRDFALNYSNTEPCPYVFRFNTDEIGDTEVNSRVLLNAKDAGLKIKVTEAYRKTGFTQPDEQEPTL